MQVTIYGFAGAQTGCRQQCHGPDKQQRDTRGIRGLQAPRQTGQEWREQQEHLPVRGGDVVAPARRCPRELIAHIHGKSVADHGSVAGLHLVRSAHAVFGPQPPPQPRKLRPETAPGASAEFQIAERVSPDRGVGDPMCREIRAAFVLSVNRRNFGDQTLRIPQLFDTIAVCQGRTASPLRLDGGGYTGFRGVRRQHERRHGG